MRRQRGDVVLPAEFGATPNSPPLKQNDWIALSRFEIAGDKAVDQNRVPLDVRHAVSQAARAKVSSWVASMSSWPRTAVSTSRPPSSQIWSAELIATPSGVGHARRACPILRSCPSVPTAACQPNAQLMQPHGALSR